METKQFCGIGTKSLVCILILIGGGSCSNILFVSMLGSLSHHIAIHPLALRLAQNGHRVTYFSSVVIPNEDKNITYFYPQKVVEVMTGILSQVGDQSLRGTNTPNIFTSAYNLNIILCEIMYGSEDVQEWIRKSTFDLLILDAVYSDCALGLAYKFRIPHITINPASFFPWQLDVYGMAPETSWLPDMRSNYTHGMSFWERLSNTLFGLEMYFSHMRNDYYPKLTEIIRNGLQDENVPNVFDLQRNVSLILVNTYFAVEYGRSLPPFVIPIGGLHCSTQNQKLSTELENFISKFHSTGFVFISFGTAFKLSEKSSHDIFEVMSKKFPTIGFIFKWNGALPTETAQNVLFTNWAPQQVLLAHPKIRAFISHCGMLSANEAAYYGVPVLAIPGFADQDFNAECLVRLGVANRLELSDLNEQNLEKSIKEILSDPKFKNRMKSISSIYRDRQNHPMDTAAWWTEYVLRHSKQGSDLDLMKPLGMNQFWFQRRLLDVYFFIILGLLTALFISTKVLCVIWRVFRSFSKMGSKNQNKKEKRN